MGFWLYLPHETWLRLSSALVQEEVLTKVPQGLRTSSTPFPSTEGSWVSSGHLHPAPPSPVTPCWLLALSSKSLT